MIWNVFQWVGTWEGTKYHVGVMQKREEGAGVSCDLSHTEYEAENLVFLETYIQTIFWLVTRYDFIWYITYTSIFALYKKY